MFSQSFTHSITSRGNSNIIEGIKNNIFTSGLFYVFGKCDPGNRPLDQTWSKSSTAERTCLNCWNCKLCTYSESTVSVTLSQTVWIQSLDPCLYKSWNTSAIKYKSAQKYTHAYIRNAPKQIQHCLFRHRVNYIDNGGSSG